VHRQDRFTRVKSLLRDACGGWRARGAGTLGPVSARVDWPKACGGSCGTRGLGRAFERSRAMLRVFRNGADSFRMKSGGRAENARALVQGETAENTRIVDQAEAKPGTPALWCRENGRERPSRWLNGGKAGNALHGWRPRTPGPWINGGKAGNARASQGMPEPSVGPKSRERSCFWLLETESREHPYPCRNSCGREHPYHQLGGLDLGSLVLRAGPLYTRGPATEWWPRGADLIGG